MKTKTPGTSNSKSKRKVTARWRLFTLAVLSSLAIPVTDSYSQPPLESQGIAGSLSGMVRNAETKAPISKAVLTLHRSGGVGGLGVRIDSTQSDAQGKYAFANVPTDQILSLAGSAPGFKSAFLGIQFGASTQVLERDVDLQPAGTVIGAVRFSRSVDAGFQWSISGGRISLSNPTLENAISIRAYAPTGVLIYRHDP